MEPFCCLLLIGPLNSGDGPIGRGSGPQARRINVDWSTLSYMHQSNFLFLLLRCPELCLNTKIFN